MIYFIQAGDNGPVKIGTARDVARRVQMLQAGNHLKLHLLRTIDGGRAAETWLHKSFRHLRLRGEWFTFDAALLTAEPPFVGERAVVRDLVACAAIRALGGPGKVAEALGLNRTQVSNWQHRGVPWRYRPKVAKLAQRAEVDLPSNFIEGDAA